MAFDFSLVTAPFRMQPGLRRVPPGMPRLTPASPSSRHFREKVAVLASHADEALCSLPGFDAMPLFLAVADETARAADDGGAAFVLEIVGAGPAFHAPRLGWSVVAGQVVGDGDAATGDVLEALPAQHRAAALLCLAFEEDFALIDGSDGTIPWLAVALPSRWAPREKIGQRFAAVHAPVADNALLLASADALSRLVTGPGDRWERFVWTITPEPRLHQHPARGMSPWLGDTPSEVAANAFFRSERQTFVPVVGARQAVFTIHVESGPLARAIVSVDAACRVRDALASMSPAVLDYRGLVNVREPLLAWLDARASALAARA